MAPLLDVVFILLIFFAVSTSIIVHNQGLDLELPAAKSVVEDVKGLTISITKSKRIIMDDQQVNIDDVTAEVRKRILSKPDTQVIFSSDRDISYELIIQVLDAIRLGGCSRIILQAEKELLNHNAQRTGN